MTASDVKRSFEEAYEWLVALREEAERRGHADIARVMTTAIYDMGSAVDRVERACERSNKRFATKGVEV